MQHKKPIFKSERWISLRTTVVSGTLTLGIRAINWGIPWMTQQEQHRHRWYNIIDMTTVKADSAWRKQLQWAWGSKRLAGVQQLWVSKGLGGRLNRASNERLPNWIWRKMSAELCPVACLNWHRSAATAEILSLSGGLVDGAQSYCRMGVDNQGNLNE